MTSRLSERKTEIRKTGIVPSLKCSADSEKDLIEMDPLDFEKRDVIVLLMEEKGVSMNLFRGQCLYREDLEKLYKNSKVYNHWPAKNIKLVKLPHLGIWVQNAEIVFKRKHSVFVLKDIRNFPIGSEFGVSTMHGEENQLYRVENFIKKSRRKTWVGTRTGKRKTIEEWDLDRLDKILMKNVKEEQSRFRYGYYTINNGHEKFPISQLDSVRDVETVKIVSHKITSIPVIPGLTELICSGCSSLRDIPVIDGMTVLDCSDCKSLTEIPVIPGLYQLNCSGCPLLAEIPVINGLENLECFSCPLITKIPFIVTDIMEIKCYDCPNLTEIAEISGMKELICYKCPNLLEIPEINTLKILNCALCDSLTEIPELDNLKKLDCSGTNIGELPEFYGLEILNCAFCKNITSISGISKLKGIDCSYCTRLVDIGNIETLKALNCSNCPLLFKIRSENMVYLNCQHCPRLLTIPNMTKLTTLKCDSTLQLPQELQDRRDEINFEIIDQAGNQVNDDDADDDDDDDEFDPPSED